MIKIWFVRHFSIVNLHFLVGDYIFMYICLLLSSQSFAKAIHLTIIPPKFVCLFFLKWVEKENKQLTKKCSPQKNICWLNKWWENARSCLFVEAAGFLLYLNAWMNEIWSGLFALKSFPANCFHNLLKVSGLPFHLTKHATPGWMFEANLQN